MATDPHASDLRAMRARLERLIVPTWPLVTVNRGDLLDLIAAYDAQAARLAALEAERDRYRKRLDELTDDSLLDGLSDTDLERYGQSSPQELYRWLLAAEAQAARLAALEAERDQYRQRANRAEARMGNYRADNRRLSEARVCVQQHNARLATLEQTVRALDVAFRLPQQEGGLLLAVLPVLQALRTLDASWTDAYKEEESCAQS